MGDRGATPNFVYIKYVRPVLPLCGSQSRDSSAGAGARRGRLTNQALKVGFSWDRHSRKGNVGKACRQVLIEEGRGR